MTTLDPRTSERPDFPAAFPIVGIGASAGGLAALEAFFAALDAQRDTGMAFVVVQHLSPDHESVLTDLIRRHTRMPVHLVEDGVAVEPDHAYIIPPNRDMALLNGTLQLLEPAEPRGRRLPVDFFFRSLARDRRERAVGIVLAGTGSDGTLGVRAIKGEGGMVMVQAPESTQHAGMPQSAIDTGLVDFVLPPAELPTRLAAYASHAFQRRVVPPALATAMTEPTLSKVFVLLQAQTGHDFSRYKRNTISRRIERRMAVHQIGQLDAYVRYLQQAPVEVDALFRDLLIGVTSFFRDAEVFAALAEHVGSQILARKAAGAQVRVWVPGVSTGEEAYSIAMLLHERAEALAPGVKTQVFATDIDTRAIDHARRGVYPASIAADVSPERLARFFVPEPGGDAYRVTKAIRDLVVFSEQDVLREPPFSRLDLISCRNLLIYLGAELQKKIIPLFHYSLNAGGLLLLGTSETVGDFVDLFTPLDRPAKLYRREEDLRRTQRPSLGALLPAHGDPRPRSGAPPATDARSRLRELTENALLASFEAVAVLVDERGDILYVHGRSGDFLEPAPGEASINVLRMAREGLRRELSAALHETIARRTVTRRADLRIAGTGVALDLTVRPVLASSGPIASSVFLVVFERRPPSSEPTPPAPARVEDEADQTHLELLRLELRAKEDYLRAANEELETSNEELKSSNEEMQSINEELQATNEELETSKEELHSVNEELSMVNAELQQRLLDLSRANNDMNNLLAGTGIGTIFVDHDLHIQRFTPAAAQVINLIATDVGRPIAHVVSNLRSYDRLVEDTREVLRDLIPKEITVQSHAGAWYSVRIRPYRTLDNVIEGGVISFFDISDLKHAQDVLRESERLRRLAGVVLDARDAMIVLDLEGRLLAWNPGAERMYGWSEAEALGMNVRALIPAARQEPELAALVGVAEQRAPELRRTERQTKDGRLIAVVQTATALVDGQGRAYGVATTEREAPHGAREAAAPS